MCLPFDAFEQLIAFIDAEICHKVDSNVDASILSSTNILFLQSIKSMRQISSQAETLLVLPFCGHFS